MDQERPVGTVKAAVPQPHPSRITPFLGNAVVAGVEPGQPELVAITAAQLASALGGRLYFAFADPARMTEQEFPDGTVRHVGLNPDLYEDEAWRRLERELVQALTAALSGTGASWEFRYLAGRPDRALTHLARAVDAAVIVVGAGRSGAGARLHEVLQRSVGTHLAHHQHRPVLVVPTSVVDWKTPLA